MSRLQYAARSVTRMVPLVPTVLSSQKVPMSSVSSDRRCRISRPILISACMTDSTDLARDATVAFAVTCMNQPYNYMHAASNWYTACGGWWCWWRRWSGQACAREPTRHPVDGVYRHFEPRRTSLSPVLRAQSVRRGSEWDCRPLLWSVLVVRRRLGPCTGVVRQPEPAGEGVRIQSGPSRFGPVRAKQTVLRASSVCAEPCPSGSKCAAGARSGTVARSCGPSPLRWSVRWLRRPATETVGAIGFGSSRDGVHPDLSPIGIH